MRSFESSEKEIVPYGRSCAEAIFGSPGYRPFNTTHLEPTNGKAARARNDTKVVGQRIRFDATFYPDQYRPDLANFKWPKDANLL